MAKAGQGGLCYTFQSPTTHTVTHTILHVWSWDQISQIKFNLGYE